VAASRAAPAAIGVMCQPLEAIQGPGTRHFS
jgi:hypothetical protein